MARPIAGKRCTFEWARHLRKYGKRVANKRLRKALKKPMISRG